MIRTIAACIALHVVGTSLAGCAMDARSADEPTGSTSAALISGVAAFFWYGFDHGSPTGLPMDGSYNSAGGTNAFTRFGIGQYRVDYPSLGSSPAGDVQVTAQGQNGERCKVGHWGTIGTTLQVWVNCFAATGASVDSHFTTSFVRRTDHPGAEGAYLWANLPTATSYTVQTQYQWNSTNATMSIAHTPGTGSYTVTLGGQDLSGGTVQITAYGSGNAYCKVGDWGGTIVDVECFDGSTGQPAESAFDLAFDTKAPDNTPSFTYAWANEPSASSYQPAPEWELGSLTSECGVPVAQSNVTITRSSTGFYGVQFPGMASADSNGPFNVKVTGYGGGSDTCEVSDLRPWGASGWASVYCFDARGAAVDAFFTITFSSFAYTVC